MKKHWTNLEHLIANDQVTSTDALEKVASHFQIRVSPTMQAQLEKEAKEEGAEGAIYRQFIPSSAEATILERELYDPIGDQRFTPTEGVVHRYGNRALLKATQLCEVYCRFCFRKEMIGNKGESLTNDELTSAYQYFREHDEIWEVILTGGDPMILSNRRLGTILEHLAAIPHIKVIRIHTRIPVVSPERIDAEFTEKIATLIDSGVMIYFAIHANHSAEFSEASADALRRLRRTGAVLVSQSVLLKGVNDSLKTLQSLMETFVQNGVQPYYLHQMDLARGTSHFVVEQSRAIELIRALRQSTSGICVPDLIQEIPEGEGKRVLY